MDFLLFFFILCKQFYYFSILKVDSLESEIKIAECISYFNLKNIFIKVEFKKKQLSGRYIYKFSKEKKRKKEKETKGKKIEV